MNRFLALIAALALLALPSAASAAPPRPGPYVAVFIGGAAPVTQDASTNDFFFNQTFNDRVRFDPGISAGGSGGYDFGFVRLEGELSYKHAEIASITEQGTSTTYRSMHGSLGAYTVMANGFIDLHNDSPVTPYFGGGVGFATLHLSDTSGKLGGVRYNLYDADDDAVFAYQAGAGLEIALNRHLSLDLGYRYFATSRASFNGDGSRESGMKFESHNGTAGLRFKF
ncbi:MAG: porin family protein [Desulfuromonadales bacterium]|nr:porin family protein [Desulfuromonadales bacterium]